MATIEEMLFLQQKANAVIADKGHKKTNGIKYYTRNQANTETRRKAEDMFEEDENGEVN